MQLSLRALRPIALSLSASCLSAACQTGDTPMSPAMNLAGGPALGSAGAPERMAATADAPTHPAMREPAYPRPLYPPENPHSDDKALLGKILFWEEQLSADGSTACGTCHQGRAGGSDPRSATDAARLPGPDGVLEPLPSVRADDGRGALGVVRCGADGMPTGQQLQVTGRKPPSAFDAMFNGAVFWDGRASKDFRDPETQALLITGFLDRQSGRIVGGALENQAVGPPMSEVEMACANPSWSALCSRIARAVPLALARDVPSDMQQFIRAHDHSYPRMFAAAFGSALKHSPSEADDVINAARIAFAIATYERLLTSNQTPWDRWNAGDSTALDAQQVRGFELFMGRANCQACHAPPLFMDLSFHYLGFQPVAQDHGKGGLTDSPPSALGMMKTPTLRNVGLREPGGLTHQGDGPGRSLERIVQLYNEGGRRNDPGLGAEIDPLLVPLELTDDEQRAIIDFLRFGLTDARAMLELPPFDRPRLGSER
ncbi:MAG TPA: cytochrome c peroxidase [Polyangiales bacterium]|nr:cytochrome c peroxidase [Polyangiales bacterium]